MIHPTTGIYAAPMRGVEKVAGRDVAPAPAQAREPAAFQDLLARDGVKVASISGAAERSMTYKLAVRSLNDIDTYLSDLI